MEICCKNKKKLRKELKTIKTEIIGAYKYLKKHHICKIYDFDVYYRLCEKYSFTTIRRFLKQFDLKY